MITINLLSFISFCSFLSFMYVGIQVLHRDWKSELNYTFFLIFCSLAIWAFGYTFFYSANNEQTARFWQRISSIGGCIFTGFTLNFFLVLMNNKKPLKAPFIYFVLYLPPVIFTSYALFGSHTPLAYDFHRINSYWGWCYLSPIHSLWFWCYGLYMIIYFSIGLFLLYKWGKNSSSFKEKKQANIIFYSDIIWLIIGFTTEFILPILKIHFPPIAIAFSIPWIIAIWYAITRYKLIPLTNKTAADLILNTMMDPVILVKENGKIASFNSATTRLLKYSPEKLKDESIENLFQSKYFDTNEIKEIISEKFIQNRDKVLVTSSNEIILTEYSASLLEDKDCGIIGIVFVFHDVTKQRNLENALIESKLKYKNIAEEMNRMAHYDQLTKLPNRRLFIKQLHKILNRSEEENISFGILFIDLDGFKAINDNLGHDAGDMLLIEVAKRLRKSIGLFDLAARIGGDEFTVILSTIDCKNDIETVVNNIFINIEKPFHIKDNECRISASIGISIYPNDGEDLDSLLNYADRAMYHIKNHNKKGYVFFDEVVKNSDL